MRSAFLTFILLFAGILPCFSEPLTCDVCVVGGGSGGFGAALAAAREGAKVILIEKNAMLGGTSTAAFVCNWEPGPGCSFAREIYQRLKDKKPPAVSIVPRMHAYQKEEPYGLAFGSKKHTVTYEDTLKRTGVLFEKRCSVVMQPEALANVMHDMLKEANVRVYLQTTFLKAIPLNDSIGLIQVSPSIQGTDIIRAKVYVDSTGSAALCRNIGCKTMLGEDSKTHFQEPSAPKQSNDFLNAISLCYRIEKKANPKQQEVPSNPVGPFGKTAFVCGVDENELIVNPLPLVDGTTLIQEGYNETKRIANLRVLAHWNWLQQYPHFRQYELKDIAPMLGIRESYRTVTEYILTENDIREGLSNQKYKDIAAIADHALDIHGGSHGAKELKEPYGIPYRCLIPKKWKNVLIACRAAGFSHIAASSCRLSRTMMALGHSAGLAAAQAARENLDARDVDSTSFLANLHYQ